MEVCVCVLVCALIGVTGNLKCDASWCQNSVEFILWGSNKNVPQYLRYFNLYQSAGLAWQTGFVILTASANMAKNTEQAQVTLILEQEEKDLFILSCDWNDPDGTGLMVMKMMLIIWYELHSHQLTIKLYAYGRFGTDMDS